MSHHSKQRVHIPVIQRHVPHAAAGAPQSNNVLVVLGKEVLESAQHAIVWMVDQLEATLVSDRGKTFIKSWEQGPAGKGLPALEIYDDNDQQYKSNILKTNPGLQGRPKGFWTIGYGHRIISQDRDDFSKGITSSKAEQLFENDLLRKSIDIIIRNIKVRLNQQQFDALASYVFNTGSLVGTQLLTKINAGDLAGAVLEMDIVTSNGVRMGGLVTRRANEQNMWLHGIYVNH